MAVVGSAAPARDVALVGEAEGRSLRVSSGVCVLPEMVVSAAPLDVVTRGTGRLDGRGALLALGLALRILAR